MSTFTKLSPPCFHTNRNLLLCQSITTLTNKDLKIAVSVAATTRWISGDDAAKEPVYR